MSHAAEPLQDASREAPPSVCTLMHPAFRKFGAMVFRQAETDHVPVLIFQLGEREAAVPITALQRELGIAAQDADGQMLSLIAKALDFVACLRPGDALPAEVLTGEASWEPEASHFALSMARLRLQLVSWISGGQIGEQSRASDETLVAMVEDPGFRPQLQSAFEQAAQVLNLADTEAVVVLIGELAYELAYIEALRVRLLQRVEAMAARIETMARRWRGDSAHSETLAQTRRLTTVALEQLHTRFEQLDAQTGEILSALRNVQSQRAFIRSNRDWLYCSLRGWEPMLAQWDAAVGLEDRAVWSLIERTYQFLAPRFMVVTEWLSLARATRSKPDRTRQLEW
jgi:hypothetical protein